MIFQCHGCGKNCAFTTQGGEEFFRVADAGKGKDAKTRPIHARFQRSKMRSQMWQGDLRAP